MSKKTKLTPLPTDKVSKTSKPKLHNRALDGINYTVLPFLGKAVIVAGFSYGVLQFLSHFNVIPEVAQGASAVFIIGAILKIATNKR